MASKYAWLLLAAFATSAKAACDIATVAANSLACKTTYDAELAKVAVTNKCPALAAYVACFTKDLTTLCAATPTLLTAAQVIRDAAVATACAGTCAGQAVCPTTTLTPWDSSASSGSDVTSLKSSYSSSFKEDSSGDSSGSAASSGSTGSGSSGSYLLIWQWLLLAALCCCCFAGAAAAAMTKKPKKKKKPTPKPVPAPAPEPVQEVIVEPLLGMPPIMPLATTSSVIPSYSMAMPTPAYAPTTAYAAPATTAYAAPATYSGYGGYPATTAAYAAPAAYSGYGGYPAGTVV